MENLEKNSGVMRSCMSETMACNDFLQTSGKCPPSLTMPPIWPPIPRAHVLQAFLLRIARHNGIQPTRLAIRNVYRMAFQPPPDFMGFIIKIYSDQEYRAIPAVSCLTRPHQNWVREGGPRKRRKTRKRTTRKIAGVGQGEPKSWTER